MTQRRISRPLSNGSLLSYATRTSDLSLSEKRRSALIHYEADETFCSSVLRAEDVLRRSQRTRNEDDRRRMNDPIVRKMRSLPYQQATQQRHNDDTTKSHDDQPHVHFRRNPTQSLLPRHSAPLLAHAPARVTLQPPDEPTSKFSCSSAESKIGSLRSKAIRASQSLLKNAPSHLSLRRRTSQNDLLDGERQHDGSIPTKSFKGTLKRLRTSQPSSASSHAKSDSVDSSVFTTSTSSKHGSQLSTSTSSSKKSWVRRLGRFISRKRSSIVEEDEKETSARSSLQIRGPLNATFESSDDNTTAALASPTANLAPIHDSMQPLMPAISLRPKPPSPDTRDRTFEPHSPGRFRDLIASASACSSPEKTSSGLPLPNTSPRSSYDDPISEPSPKKRALGPEQIIGMEEAWLTSHHETDWIVEQKRATTDLAALLSGLEETEDISRRVDDKSIQSVAPQVSVDSIVSDVPQDLHQLILAVSDHLSEYSVTTEAFDQYGQRVTFSRQDDTDSSMSDDSEGNGEPPLSLQAYARQQHGNAGVSPSGTLSTGPESPHSPPGSLPNECDVSTAGSFAGVATDAVSAAAALRRMIESDDTAECDSRDSAMSVLQMGRPTLGEKMLDEVDFAVSLASLVPDYSPALPTHTTTPDLPVSVRREMHQDMTTSSSEGWSQAGRESPVPLPVRLPRGSLVRYSQIVSGPTLPVALEATLDSIAADPKATAGPKQTVTSNGSGSGSQSTNLSISSLPFSPCNEDFSVPWAKRGWWMRFKPEDVQPARTNHKAPVAGVGPSPRSRQRSSSKGSSKSLESSPRSLRQIPLQPSSGIINHLPGHIGHSRQVSVASSISQSVIVEDEEENEFSKAEASVPSEMVFDLQSEFGVPPVAQTSTVGLDLGASHRGSALKIDDTVDQLLDELHRIMDVEEAQVHRVLRNWTQFDSDARDEIRASHWKWPDTEWSREALAHFLIPTRVRDILLFILDSQTRFRSCVPPRPHASSILGLRSPPIYPDHALSPATPFVSDTSMQTDYAVIDKPVSPVRYSKPSKPVNRRILATNSINASESTKGFSPFTALPPKLSIRKKLRSSSLVLVDNSVPRKTVSPSKRKSGVDTSFLGDSVVSKRRKDQFDAARRKLDGVGTASEQQSEEDTIEFDRTTLGTGSTSFQKSVRVY
ncbi:hypothetical protein OIV83_005657 [Microbotryomycetes sp. JL201]|nr:hypothetical protein OIV83_005657 [Microbotryomycetes sp. JL201]